MRGRLVWLLAAAGVVVVLIASAAIGGNDKSGDKVPAGEWAQSVCGAVGVWRGEIEATIEQIRTPNANGTVGEEPQSETPQGRTGFIRKGLERSVEAAKTLVEGVDNAGVPDTPQGEQAAQQVSDWAASSLDDLEAAQDSLDKEADSLEASVDQLTQAAGAIASTLASGVATIAEVARLDPELARTVLDTSTCQQLRAERNQ